MEEQAKPLDPAPSVSPSLFAEEDPAKLWWHQKEYPAAQLASRSRRCRRVALVCCGCFSALVAIVAVLLLVLALTIYRVRDPRLTLNGIFINASSAIHENRTREHEDLSGLGAVVADILVRNPNRVAYYFEESYTTFYCAGVKVAGAYGSPGRLAPGLTYRVNVTVDVDERAMQEAAGEAEEKDKGEMRVDSTTAIKGHVWVLGMVRYRVDLNVRCTISLVVRNWTVVGQACMPGVWD